MKTSALLISGLITLNAFAQDKPKLVIGIVIDQITSIGSTLPLEMADSGGS